MKPDRFYGMDFLRSAMLFLGLVLHTAQYYMVMQLFQTKYDDPSASYSMDFLLLSINTFRMHEFFLISGFFTAMLYEKYGRRELLRRRMKRLLIPFLLFWPTLGTVETLWNKLWLTYRAHDYWGLHQSHIDRFPEYLMDTEHYWFLYYLILYVLVIWLLLPVLEKLPDTVKAAYKAIMNFFLKNIRGHICLGLVFALFGWFQEAGRVSGDLSFLPGLAPLGFYFLFVVIGWALYGVAGYLDAYRKHGWKYLFAALLCFVLALVSFSLQGAPGGDQYMMFHALLAGFNGVAVAFFVIGFIGIAQRYFDKPSPRIRYLSDSAYWVYILHLPVITGLAQLLHDWVAPAEVKFLTVLVTSTAICLFSYDLFVRDGWLGQLLNGRRMPRGLPKPQNATLGI